MTRAALLAWWLIAFPDLTSADPRPYVIGPPHATQAACAQIVAAFLASPAQWARHAVCLKDPR